MSSLSMITYYGNDGSSVRYNISFEYHSPEPGYAKDTTFWKPPALFSNSAHEDFGARLVDLNNDGFIDIIQYKASGTNKAWINDQDNNWTEEVVWHSPLSIVNDAGADDGVRFADVNNDGFIDLIRSEGGYHDVYLNNGTGWEGSNWEFPMDIIDNEANDLGVLLVDLNNDGKIDVVKARDGEARSVYLNNGSGWKITTTNWNSPVDIISGANDKGVRFVDVNGDGLTDILESSEGYSTQNAWLNDGDGWANSAIWIPPVYFTTGAHKDKGTRLADVNGDGLVDILVDFANSTSSERSAWINTGNGWEQDDSWKSTEAFTSAGYNVGRRLADLNGDGFADIIVSHQDSSNQYVWIKNNTLPYLLKVIVNEYGGKTSLNYTTSTSFNNSEDGTSDIGFNIWVVSNVTSSNEIDGSLNISGSTRYNYSFGKYNYENFEFRGFGKSTEVRENSLVNHYFYQDDPRRGKEWKTEIPDYSITIKDYNYTQKNGIYNLSLRYSSSYLYDGSNDPKVTNKTFTYDYYGNPLFVTDLGDVLKSGDEKYYNYSYAYNDELWIMDKITKSLVMDENKIRIKETKYYYDELGLNALGSKGALTKKEEWNNEGNNTFTYFEYDRFGNIVKSTDSLGNSISYNYDNSNTYPVSMINALGHLTTYSYDLGTGNLLFEEKNGIRKNFEYDHFGRIVKEIMPYDSPTLPTKEYSYSFDGSAPEEITISLKTTSNKTNKVRYFYDGFANLIQLKTDIEQGQIVKNIFYDSLGRVSKEQNPYFADFNESLSNISNDENYTFYTYDSLDRVVGVYNPDGTMKNITFDRWNITDRDENGNYHLYEIDAFGRIVKVYEYFYDSVIFKNETFVTSYEYDGNDNLVLITDNEGNEFKFTYDSLGRKIKMDDPDLGVWKYKYDQNGNLMFQSGGGGNLISDENYHREYDAFGQLSRIRNGTLSTSPIMEEYVYDQDGQRIKIIRNDSANTTIYTPFKEFMRITNLSGSFDYTYIYDGDTLIARKNPDGSVQYDHLDHLGSVGVVTNSTGGVIETTLYEPYGKVISGGEQEDKLYTGQFADDDCQYYYNARYYNPCNGLFIQPDIMLPNVYDSQQLNHYSYVMNNPYKYTDPNGLWAVTVGVGGQAGAVVGLGGDTSLGISYSKEEGLQGGVVFSGGTGLFIGAEAQIAGSAMFYPKAKSLRDLDGKSVVAEVSGFFGGGGGARTAFESTEEADEFWKKLRDGDLGLEPVGYGGVLGGGGGASGSVFVTGTKVFSGRIFGGRSTSYNNVNHVYNNPSLSKSSKDSVAKSMAYTSSSEGTVNWYYNDNRKTYTYQVGGSKPSGGGWSKI